MIYFFDLFKKMSEQDQFREIEKSKDQKIIEVSELLFYCKLKVCEICERLDLEIDGDVIKNLENIDKYIISLTKDWRRVN
jgi:hypothetical protein